MIEIVLWFIAIISFSIVAIYCGIQIFLRYDEQRYYEDMRVLLRLGLFETVKFKTVSYYDDYTFWRMKQIYKYWD